MLYEVITGHRQRSLCVAGAIRAHRDAAVDSLRVAPAGQYRPGAGDAGGQGQRSGGQSLGQLTKSRIC